MTNESVQILMFLWNASVETADHWFRISWFGLIVSGVIAALSALSTVGFIFVQFWSSSIREENTALDIARAHEAASLADERAAKANEHAALLETYLLAERRLTANERWRLERVERAVLPRQVAEEQRSFLLKELTGKGESFNIAFVDRQEPMSYALQLRQVFQQAGFSVDFFPLPRDANELGVTTYVANEGGRAIAQTLWKVRIGGGSITLVPADLKDIIPAGNNCLIVGENDAAFQPRDGQPGEGIDEHGRPVPAPQ